MTTNTSTGVSLKWVTGVLALAAGAYAGYAGLAWMKYRHAAAPRGDELDPLLDRLMPVYDIAERHHIDVAAPAGVTLSAACETDLFESKAVRAIFRAREKILGTEPAVTAQPRGLLALTKSIGWGVLAEVPGHEVVMGAVTKPWEANVVFRPIPPEQFAAFNEPGYVKIAWTLRADAKSATDCVFRTETRAVATDRTARTKFRRYWSLLSPGIITIRWIMLRPVRVEAERRAARAKLSSPETAGAAGAESGLV